MGAAETNALSPTSQALELTDLTPTEWRRLEARLSDDELATLEGLRKQWLNAAGLLEVWLDPVLYEIDTSYERALAAVESAETEFRAFVRRIRQRYGV